MVIALMLGAIGLSWLGGSESGRAWVAGQISTRASSDDLSITLGEIKTLNNRQIVISHITLNDPKGPFATLNTIEIDYSAEHLLMGNMHINRITIQDIAITRLPEKTDPQQDATIPKVPNLHIEAFTVAHLDLAPAIMGKQEILALAGKLVLSSQIKSNDIELHIEDKNTGNILADLIFAPDADGLNLKASIHDDGQGLLARITGLPMVNLSIKGTGSMKDWQGQLTANTQMKTGAVFETESDLALNLAAKRPTLKLTGKTAYDFYTIDGETLFTLSQKTKKLKIAFQGDLAGDGFTFNDLLLQAQLDHKGSRLNIAHGRLKTPIFEVTTNGYWDRSDQRIKLNTKANITDLTVLSADLSGAAMAESTISGHVSPLNLQAPLRLQAQNFTTSWGEVNKALGTAPSAKAALSFINGALDIKDGAINGAALKTLDFSGDVNNGQTALTIAANYQDHNIKTVLKLNKQSLALEPIDIKGEIGIVTGNAHYDLNNKHIKAALILAQDDKNNISVNVSGAANNIIYDGAWKGLGAYPFTFTYDGAINSDKDIIVKLNTLKGDYGPNHFALKKPTQLSIHPTPLKAHIDALVLGINDGSLQASGDFKAKEFSAAIKAENLPTNFNIYPFVFDGRFAGDIDLSGSYSNPIAQADVTLKRLSIPSNDADENRYMDGHFTAHYQDHIVTAEADLAGPAELKFKAKASLPLTVAPFGIPFDKPVSGTLNSSVDLKALSLLLGLDEHSIAGRSALDVALSGTLNNPIITGNGNLRQGKYENLLLGTNLQDIAGEVSASNNRLTLKNLEGSDTNGGRFTGHGHIDFKNIREPQYQFALDTKNLQLVNTDSMGVSASGQLTAEGDMDAADVKGQIVINQAEYYIAQIITTSSLSSFTIIEEDRYGHEIINEKSKQHGPDVNLSIGIQANNSVFVRGSDLETEWSGQLDVTGTTNTPELKGDLSLVRGRFQLLDTPVQLSKGLISFTNADPSNPDIDISGTIKGRDMDATLRITGEAKAPEIALQSDSDLPEDEILAKTLFGASVSQLSPMQALRIGQLIASLSGRQEATFDPLNDIRRAIGIDTLSVGMDDEKGATLSVGKYVSDKIYIGIDQGTTPGSSAVRAEIEVSNDIEVETMTSGTNESSMGINWKRDY